MYGSCDLFTQEWTESVTFQISLPRFSTHSASLCFYFLFDGIAIYGVEYVVVVFYFTNE